MQGIVGQASDFVEVVSNGSTELSRARFDEERSKKLWYGFFA